MGSRAIGNDIWGMTDTIIFLRYLLLILRVFVQWELAIFCGTLIKLLRLTPQVWQTWIRICPTMSRGTSQSLVYHLSGSGARLGVATVRRQLLRPSICAKIQSARKASCSRRAESHQSGPNTTRN